MKKTLLLSVCAIIACFTANAGLASWSVSSDGKVLTFSGDGYIDDYEFGDETPWEDYKSTITTVEIGDGIDYIGEYAFAGCHNLVNINVDSDNTYLYSVDGVVYRHHNRGNMLVCFPVGRKGSYEVTAEAFALDYGAFMACELTEIILTDATYEMGELCFAHSENLQKVTFPSTFSTCDGDCFYECNNVKEIVSLTTTPTNAGRNFPASVKTTCVVYVPEGCLEAYKASDYWKDYTDIREITSTGIEGINTTVNAMVNVYNMQGAMVRSAVEASSATQGLTQGLYIVGTKKVLVK